MQSKPNNVVKLNVGGSKFQTTEQTLLLHGPSFFSSLIKNSNRDYDNEYFIDRDSRLFHIILNYMRKNTIDFNEKECFDFSDLLNEAMFYQLDSLVLKINMLKSDNFNECGNILFNGVIHNSEPTSLAVRIFDNEPLLLSRMNQSHHRNCASVDLTSTNVRLYLDNQSADDNNSNHPVVRNNHSYRHHRLSEQMTTQMSPLVSRQSNNNSQTNQSEPTTSSTATTNGNNDDSSGNDFILFLQQHHFINRTITIIKCSQKWMALAHPFYVSLFWLCDINGWTCVWKSPINKSTNQSSSSASKNSNKDWGKYLIRKIALTSKLPQINRGPNNEDTNHLLYEVQLAIATEHTITLYVVLLNVVVSCPIDYQIVPISSSISDSCVTQYSSRMPIDQLIFLGGHLLALSTSQSAFAFWQSQAQRWHNCSVNAQINCYSVMNEEFILLGCENGGIYQLNAQKFPLRMSDNSVLYTEMFRDPSNDAISALDIYDNSHKCCSHVSNCLEIAYGTHSGKIRIVVQHAGVSVGPKIFQTLSVHKSSICKIVISEKYLISMCESTNHIRSWLISRFRGTINTQPGTTSLASYHLICLDVEMSPTAASLPPIDCPQMEFNEQEDILLQQQVHKIIQMNTDLGPYTDHLIFIQKFLPMTNRLFIRLAHNGQRVCCIESGRQYPVITAFALHQSDIGGTITLVTGHDNDCFQLWQLSTALDRLQSICYSHANTNCHLSTGAAMEMLAGGCVAGMSLTGAINAGLSGTSNHFHSNSSGSSSSAGGAGGGGGSGSMLLSGNNTSLPRLSSNCVSPGNAVVIAKHDKFLIGSSAHMYPHFDSPSVNGPSPRELFEMLRDYDISSYNNDSVYSFKLTPCISNQSLYSELSSKNSTLQRHAHQHIFTKST